MKASRRVRREARQLFRLCVVDSAVNEDRARDVARRIAGSGRRDALPVLSAFQRLVRLDRDRHSALVESAAPLTDTLRAGVETDLARVYGSNLHLTFRQNPALIGGMRIRVGSDVYDGTLAARLAALEARL
jgi:F-type H+-transporting ATPase subunit delta